MNPRREKTQKMLLRYPDNIPVVIHSEQSTTQLPKNKFLVPRDFTFAQFHIYIREKFPDLDASKALYFFINNTIPMSTQTFNDLYCTHIDTDDYCLHIHYDIENTFG